MSDRIKPAPVIALDGPATFVRATLRARGTALGGTKLTVRRRTSRYSWLQDSYIEGDWT